MLRLLQRVVRKHPRLTVTAVRGCLATPVRADYLIQDDFSEYVMTAAFLHVLEAGQ
jgi:hypothetical protein